MIKVGDLSNDELLVRLREHVGRGNVWLVGLLAYVGELDARRLYAEQACTSTWDYCVRRLGMSEGEAHRRIAAARVLRKFPLARTYLERGQIHLCAIYELYKHITEDNHEELLREAAGKTTKEVSAMIAARFPKPDVHPCTEPLEPQPALPGTTTGSVSCGDACSAAPSTTPGMRPRVEPLSATRYRIELTVSCETKEKLERVRDLMRHRNPSGDLEKIFDISIDLLLRKLEKERLGKTSRPKVGKSATHSDVKSMNSALRDDASTAHRDDTMDAARERPAGRLQRRGGTKTHRDDAASSSTRESAFSALGEQAMGPRRGGATAHREQATGSRRDDATAHHEQATGSQRGDATTHREQATGSQRGAATAHHEQAGSQRGDASNSRSAEATSSLPVEKTTTHRRHIPRAVWREVVARDEEQCTYVDAEGNRCPARGSLELDHVKAKALGGGDDIANLRLRCTVHNRLHAEQVFGREYIAQRIHDRRRKSAAACLAPAFETAARGLRSLGFREHEVRNVIAQLAASLDQKASVETVIRDALRLLT